MLKTYHLLFTTVVVRPLELDDHSGAALRGNLFESVWQRFCTNKLANTCAECPLHTMCPVSALVAPLREERPRGRDVPRPYIILPPLGDARRYEPGETFAFGLTLFGTIIELLPYIVLSLNTLEASGLGRKLPENRGQRGTFKIQCIESYHPITGERQALYQAGKAVTQAPTLAVTPEDIARRAATLAPKRVTLDFLTPTRLVDREQLVRSAAFRPLVLRLLERRFALEVTYGELREGEEMARSPHELYADDLVRLATDIVCTRDDTMWEEVQSYSNRQHRFTPISGFHGKATFSGDMAPFADLLVWGELIHVGKNVVKGNGWYKIDM